MLYHLRTLFKSLYASYAAVADFCESGYGSV